MPANPAIADERVVPAMTSTNSAVNTTSAIITAPRSNLPGEWLAVSVRRAAEQRPRAGLAITVLSPDSTIPKDDAAERAPDDLSEQVPGHLAAGRALQRPHADRHRRIDVAAGDVPEQVRGAQQAQTEGESNAEYADVGTDVMTRRSRSRAHRRSGSSSRSPRRRRCAADRVIERPPPESSRGRRSLHDFAARVRKSGPPMPASITSRGGMLHPLGSPIPDRRRHHEPPRPRRRSWPSAPTPTSAPPTPRSRRSSTPSPTRWRRANPSPSAASASSSDGTFPPSRAAWGATRQRVRR